MESSERKSCMAEWSSDRARHVDATDAIVPALGDFCSG
jgi:hypothetical protein